MFKLKENKTSVHREVIAGLTTFATMSYIIVVQPMILQGAWPEDEREAKRVVVCLRHKGVERHPPGDRHAEFLAQVVHRVLVGGFLEAVGGGAEDQFAGNYVETIEFPVG